MLTELGPTTSVWNRTSRVEQFPTIPFDQKADVCIIGAGIAGLSVAYQLSQAGKSVVVIDDGLICNGATGRTTAHLTYVLDERFHGLEKLHGFEHARLAIRSHQLALDQIETIVRREQIECGFERVPGYLYASRDEDIAEIDREYDAAQRFGLLEVQRVERVPFSSFVAGPALMFPRQAQFHPIPYANALTEAIYRNGGRIFTETHADKIEGGSPTRVHTRGGATITSQATVVATQAPINHRLAIHTKQSAYRTYVIGVTIPPEYIKKGLYWDTDDPYHYIRLAKSERQQSPEAAYDILIVGGEDHKTGQDEVAQDHFTRLEEWTMRRFPKAREVRYRWSGQVVYTVDRLAYIGRDPTHDQNIYMVTGDSGNGITYGTIAGMLLSDEILEKKNPCEMVYDPSRITLGAAGTFAAENLNALRQYADWAKDGNLANRLQIKPGDGGIVSEHGRKIAVYRDENGKVHECSAVCPHLGGIVRWNNVERTWDCPCHGSRFDRFGQVINGPSICNLAPIAKGH